MTMNISTLQFCSPLDLPTICWCRTEVAACITARWWRWRLGAVPWIVVLKLQRRFSSQWSQGNRGYGCFHPEQTLRSDSLVGFCFSNRGSKTCVGLSTAMEIRWLGTCRFGTELPTGCGLPGHPWKINPETEPCSDRGGSAGKAHFQHGTPSMELICFESRDCKPSYTGLTRVLLKTVFWFA